MLAKEQKVFNSGGCTATGYRWHYQPSSSRHGKRVRHLALGRTIKMRRDNKKLHTNTHHDYHRVHKRRKIAKLRALGSASKAAADANKHTICYQDFPPKGKKNLPKERHRTPRHAPGNDTTKTSTGFHGTNLPAASKTPRGEARQN